MANSNEALGSMCLAFRRLSKGVYHLSPPCKLSRCFLDGVGYRAGKSATPASRRGSDFWIDCAFVAGA